MIAGDPPTFDAFPHNFPAPLALTRHALPIPSEQRLAESHHVHLQRIAQ